MPVLDAFKAIACLMIVMHHLAAYGPMSDVAYPLFPGLIDWLYQYGRMAVQAFFVMAGFLAARKFAPHGESLVASPWPIIGQRYVRLAVPYLVALMLAIGCAALAREWMNHDSIPAAPSIPQLLAHALLLQDLLHQEALSAGVWYIAIDFQLFALTALVLWLPRRVGFPSEKIRATAPLLVAALTLSSLFVFNRNHAWDQSAVYFFGSYGLGMLGYWASNRRHSKLWLGLLVALAIAALLVEFRERIAVAGILMLALALSKPSSTMGNWAAFRPLAYLGRISFSVFLVHFPLLLLVNATFFHIFPQQPVANALGMLLAIGISILGGGLFYTWVENRPFSKKIHLLLPAGFLSSGLLAASGIS
ncbi:MAG: acyltransferase [Sulfurimicrobium sp.]|nr:acyltransferase [Sulfurimicrobium sp.]MDP1703898.1 acyltransferase [Sulfurimicrobium sp.]MDP2197122.1 acyltransferase [Sulfurimicrobium sp.]MDP3687138.1 acyltransferase [Sulfurimicrobium sp.]